MDSPTVNNLYRTTRVSLSAHRGMEGYSAFALRSVRAKSCCAQSFISQSRASSIVFMFSRSTFTLLLHWPLKQLIGVGPLQQTGRKRFNKQEAISSEPAHLKHNQTLRAGKAPSSQTRKVLFANFICIVGSANISLSNMKLLTSYAKNQTVSHVKKIILIVGSKLYYATLFIEFSKVIPNWNCNSAEN